MTLETATRLKGIAALVLPLITIAWAFTAQPGTAGTGLSFVLAGCLLAGPLFGISWMRSRKRMRELSYAGRVLAKGR